MKLRHFSISLQGDSHIKSNTNCQDSSGSILIKNDILNAEMVIAVIADGVGSATYSEFGSQIAVKTVLQTLSQELTSIKELSEKTVLQLIKKSFQQANNNIESEADKKELPFLLFDTTLTVAVLIEDGTCYVGHIGDDGIVALFDDGTYSMITSRIEGEEANSVFPLSSKNYWTFGVVKKRVAALALMTDGLLDKSVGSARLKNRVFYPFFKPMFENIMESDQDEIDLYSRWKDDLADSQFRTDYGVTDDITLSVVQIPAILKNVHPQPFDEEKWEDQSQQARIEIDKALGYDPAETASDKKPQSPTVASPTSTTDYGINQTAPNLDSNKHLSENTNPINDPISNNNWNQTAPITQTSEIGKHSSSTNKTHLHPTNQPNFPQQPEKSPRSSHFIISAIALLCALGTILLSGKIGHDMGIKNARQQEQAAMELKISTLQQEHAVAIQAEYERGKQDGIQAALSVPTETPAVTSTPQPQITTPEEFVISLGQKGTIVKTIQEKLISKGWIIKSDGDFGKNTAKAVREFQSANRLPVTGKVDILTYWALLYDENINEETPEQDSSITTPFPQSEDQNVEKEEENASVTDAPPTFTPFLGLLSTTLHSIL